MNSVDRADFAKGKAYEDSPQYIGYGVTISAPHMVGLVSTSKVLFIFKLIFDSMHMP